MSAVGDEAKRSGEIPRVLNEGDIRDLAVEIVDAVHGHTLEFSNQPNAHEHDYDHIEGLLQRTLGGWLDGIEKRVQESEAYSRGKADGYRYAYDLVMPVSESSPLHELRFTLSDGGLVADVVCLADPQDFERRCTYYAVGVYPCTKDDQCFVVESSRDLSLEEMLGQFAHTVVLPGIPVRWDVEREGDYDWASLEPVPQAEIPTEEK